MAKPRNKKYQPKSDDNVKLKMQPWKMQAVFQPLEDILNQLEKNGTVDATTGGTPIFKDAIDGHWYESSEAIMGVVEAYEIHEIRSGCQIGLSSMRQLAHRLKYSMAIFESDTVACRACLQRMKRETMQMTAGYARQLIKDFQIKEQLEKVKNQGLA